MKKIFLVMVVTLLLASGCNLFLSQKKAESLAADKVKDTFRDSYKSFIGEIDPTAKYIQESEINSAIDSLYADASYKENDVWNVVVKSPFSDNQITVKVYSKDDIVLPDGINNNVKEMLNFLKEH